MILVNWEEDAKVIVKNFSRKEMDRLNAIIAMDIMVRNMNNESAYFTWIYLVPDCANEYDFIDFAKNEEGTENVRRHIVGGANRTLFSVDLPPRLCRTGT